MLRISAASLLLLGMGFLQVTFSTASTQAHPGQSVTMWCEHDIHVSGDLYWFKQTDGDVPITIVRMLYTESLQKVEPKYFNGFTKQHLVMDLFSKSTTLTIKYANISDSGFYFCGATGYRMKFGNGTRLEVKDSKCHNDSSTIFNHSEKNVISEKNDTRISKKDDDKSPVSSTKECSRDIFFTLTLLFGCIIVFACIIPLIMAIIKEHKRQKIKKVVVAECQTQQHDDKENDSVEYAAVHFKNKRPKTAGRHAEYSTAMYTDTT
ncbi:novel immune-type receptor 10a isoform X4 [Chanodichthys erythropterus]|uniref:novel immune-type receptor 10a isoform X4 n=1 Tax=Chanodichthys erythropterus TaxID=933992 RepID=UPI00351F1155